jgi:type I restriction enzyme S subunit
METAVKNTTKRYDKYKPSGVEWLGDIPEHWEVKRFKHISNIQKGKLPQKIVTENLTNLPPYMSMEYLRGGEENQWVFDKNAKIINDNETLLLWDGSNAGEFIKSRKGVISSTVAQIDFYNIDKGFAWYYSKFLEIELRKKTIGMGIPHVNGTELKNFSVVIPSHEEQTSIVEFLDDKTTKIDQAIAIKQQQIDLLKERRQILIHKAVTQGINPNVKLKDSGVEWIGEIPEGWVVKRCKYLFDEINDRSQTGKEELLSVSHMTGVTPRSEKNVSMFQSEDYTGSKLCQKDDLVYNIMWAWMGALGVSKQTGIVSPSYAVYRQKIHNSFNVVFLENILKGIKYVEHYNKVSTGLHSSRLRFYSTMFFEMPIAYPSKDEQDDIVEFINSVSNKIATAIAIKEQEIENLKEYKSSLIDGIVTGKIRVC